MLARESVRVRLESEHGISYTEFSYMLLQANDYLWLHDHLGCELQMGGSDQWGNIISGVDLIRRKRQAAVHALSWPLLTAADGTKLGKSTGARLWLDPAKTSPYQFHQHWVQLEDREVERQFMVFSLRPLDEISMLLAEHATAPERRLAQRALADEITALVHGPEAAQAAARGRRRPVRWRSAGCVDGVAGDGRPGGPLQSLRSEALADVVELLVGTGLATSKTDARRQLQQGSVRANGVQLSPEQGLEGVTAAPRPVPSAPQGQAELPPRGDFFARRLTLSDLVDSVALRPREPKSAPEQARHQRRRLPLAGSPVRAKSFGSLKTEEKTNASAGSESKRPSGRETTLSVNFVADSHRSQTRTKPA